MKKTWVFFKLRMLQLSYDKTALFFCYVLPVLLLLGLGYVNRDAKIEVAYSAAASGTAQAALVEYLGKHELVDLKPYADTQVPAKTALENNDIRHYLDIGPGTASDGSLQRSDIRIYANSMPENRVENEALRSVVAGFFEPGTRSDNGQKVSTGKAASYLANLLPGLIGMTLLIIGLNGFGAVLIEEENHGLYKNIKTIDVSPVPFLAGFFLSRLVVAYSVAIALYALGVLVFGVPFNVNYLLLLLVVTLGASAFLAMGLAFATISPSVTAFSGITNVVQMPLILLGGVFISVSKFPEWVQTIAHLMPLTQLNVAMRALMFDSVTFADTVKLLPQIGGLAAWSVLALVVARLKFRW